jgi:hypothetical protein
LFGGRPKLGSNFETKMVFEPSDSICCAKALFKPCMMETMKVSVTTPIATPKIVSAERSLFALTVAIAIAADSLMSSKDITPRQKEFLMTKNPTIDARAVMITPTPRVYMSRPFSDREKVGRPHVAHRMRRGQTMQHTPPKINRRMMPPVSR